ncbi:MAG: hybrid sensor histidine kinase/response regulator [Verrucomicrobiae bacterium]|nr:hybrid sensor histidine kinase/response regulator [Verrucomicrobiae bacterium]
MEPEDIGRPKVLLVDDERIVLEACLRLLRKEPFDLSVTTSPGEALEWIGRETYAVVLADHRMAGMTGTRLLEEAKAVSPDTIRLMLTGHAEASIAIEAINRGAVHRFLVKPWDNEELRSVIRQSVEQFQLVRDHRRLQELTLRQNRELQDLNQVLENKNAELEKLNDLKNQFLGMAAHDLRNPLSIVRGYSDLLSRDAAGALSESQRMFIDEIKNASKLMGDLIGNLLDTSAIEAGELRLFPRQVRIEEIIRHNVELNNFLAERKQIKVRFVSRSIPPPLSADPGKIEQVLNNLIGNAIKFSPAGSQVVVELNVQGGSAVVSVKDYGQGIPGQELDKLFKPFGVTSARATGGEKSTGLGLAIVRKIVEGHGGKVGVKSQVGMGTVFFFSLPLSNQNPALK